MLLRDEYESGGMEVEVGGVRCRERDGGLSCSCGHCLWTAGGVKRRTTSFGAMSGNNPVHYDRRCA